MGPRLDIAELARAVTLFNRVYARHSAGCCLHIVLDDNNVDDHHVEFCIQWNKENPCDNPSECAELAALMLRMTKTQRAKLGARGYDSFARSLTPEDIARITAEDAN